MCSSIVNCSEAMARLLCERCGQKRKARPVLLRLVFPLACIRPWPRTGNSGVASDYDAAAGRIQVTSGVIMKVRSDACLRESDVGEPLLGFASAALHYVALYLSVMQHAIPSAVYDGRDKAWCSRSTPWPASGAGQINIEGELYR